MSTSSNLSSVLGPVKQSPALLSFSSYTLLSSSESHKSRLQIFAVFLKTVFNLAIIPVTLFETALLFDPLAFVLMFAARLMSEFDNNDMQLAVTKSDISVSCCCLPNYNCSSRRFTYSFVLDFIKLGTTLAQIRPRVTTVHSGVCNVSHTHRFFAFLCRTRPSERCLLVGPLVLLLARFNRELQSMVYINNWVWKCKVIKFQRQKFKCINVLGFEIL